MYLHFYNLHTISNLPFLKFFICLVLVIGDDLTVINFWMWKTDEYALGQEISWNCFITKKILKVWKVWAVDLYAILHMDIKCRIFNLVIEMKRCLRIWSSSSRYLMGQQQQLNLERMVCLRTWCLLIIQSYLTIQLHLSQSVFINTKFVSKKWFVSNFQWQQGSY